MNETGKKIEKIGNSASSIIEFLSRNAKIIRQNYTFDDLFMKADSEHFKVKFWLEQNNLNMRVMNYQKKRVELYVNNCKSLAVKIKMR